MDCADLKGSFVVLEGWQRDASTESFGDKILTYLYPVLSQSQGYYGWVIPCSFILSFYLSNYT